MTANHFTAHTILVVEDNDEIRELLVKALERKGYIIVTAQDGEQAIAVAEQTHPALILLDLNLPKLDGFSAAKRIRQLPGLEQVPIIANSAYGQLGMEFITRDAELGGAYSDYITKPLGKPFDLSELEDLLHQLLPHGAPPFDSSP